MKNFRPQSACIFLCRSRIGIPVVLIALFLGSLFASFGQSPVPQGERECDCTPLYAGSRFVNPELIAGLDLEVGAVYRFSNIFPDNEQGTVIDALVEVAEFTNGASLRDIDVSDQGRNAAFQPQINSTNFEDQSVRFIFTFVSSGGNFGDELELSFYASPFDIDGDDFVTREYVELSEPDAYFRARNTALNIERIGSNIRGTALTEEVAPNSDISGNARFTFSNYWETTSKLEFTIGKVDGDTDRFYSLRFDRISYSNPVSTLVTAPVICGTVTDKTGIALAGADIGISGNDGSNANVTSDGNGNYRYAVPIADRPSEVTYTISENDPDGYVSVSDVDGANDNRILRTLGVVSSCGNDFIDLLRPLAQNDDVIASESSPIDIDALENDINVPELGNLRIDTGPTNGTATVNDNGTPNTLTDDVITYEPDPGFTGEDTILYRFCDADPTTNCTTATIFINVAPTPSASDDTATTDRNESVVIGVLDNDSDVPADAELTIVDGPGDGARAFINVDNSVNYTPAADFTGTDTFTYQICNTAGSCDTADVNVIVVLPIPDIGDDTATTESGNPVIIDVLDNDPQVPIPGSLRILSGPLNGSVSVNQGSTLDNPSDDTITYTSNADFSGTETFDYELCDTLIPATCRNARVTVTVLEPAPIPTPRPQNDNAATEEGVPVNIDILSNDTDIPETGTFLVFQGPANGSISLLDGGTPDDISDDIVRYTPSGGFSGADSFEYEICNEASDCARARVSLTVIASPSSTDTDGDGIADTTDLDDDNDGILDTDESCGNLIVNPSFEVQDFSDTALFPNGNTAPNGTYIGSDLNTNELAGWTISENIDGWIGGRSPSWGEGNTFIPALDGRQYLDLIGDTRRSGGVANLLSQTVNTVPGEIYTFSFYWGEPTMVFADYAYNLTIDVVDTNGGVLLEETLTGVTEGARNGFIGPPTWFYYESTFIATTSQTTVRFTSPPNPPRIADGASLDLVRIVKGTSAECTDTDNDGLADALDLDSDNDGIPDNVEAQNTVGYVAPDGAVDANGIDTAYSGGLVPVNTDTDAVPDYLDGDSDNDGINDVSESGLILSGSDADNDGLDDISDATSGYSDAGGTIDNPLSGPVRLPDADNDAPGGGDVDFRDDTTVVPVAVADSANTDEDVAIDIDVLINDTNVPSSGILTVNVQPANGNASVNGNDSPDNVFDDFVEYTPNPDFSGSDTFEYEICDGLGNCSTALVTVEIDEVVDVPAPLANPDTYTTNEDSEGIIDVLENDESVPTTGTLTISVGPENGNAIVNLNDSPEDPSDDTITYVPDTGFNGTDTFEYDICNGNGVCASATATVTVNEVIVVPVPQANDDTYTTEEGSEGTIDILGNDESVPTIGSLTVTVEPENGTAIVNDGGTPTNPSDNTITYAPEAGFSGSDTFDYEICDGDGICASATVTVTVNEAIVVPVPQANPDTYTTDEGSAGTIDVLENDRFVPTTGTLTVSVSPENGSATTNDNGSPQDPSDDTITYSPDEGFSGTDTFEYEICDGFENCNTATVEVTVESVFVTPTPLANADAATTNENTPIEIDVLSNDESVPNVGTLAIPDEPANGNTTINDNGTPNDPSDNTLTYIPNEGFNGTDTFEYQLCDGTPNCSTAIVNVTIIEVLELLDSDNDGIVDVEDPDDDNDSILDTEEGLEDPDSDGVPNSLDLDSDNDGILDSEEQIVDRNRDFDGDGIPNRLDLDSDNDGITDTTEAGGTDTDGDGRLDGFTDANSDGLDDIIADNRLPLFNSDANPIDNPDYLDIDADDDGLPDNIEAQPTFGYVPPNGNTDANGFDTAYPIGITPQDSEGDTLPDYRDRDSDNDGIEDLTEGDRGFFIRTDSDGDGLVNGFEGSNTDDPFDVNDEIDDPAGLPDLQSPGGEVDYRQVPSPDTDGDGVDDSQETVDGTDPNDPCDFQIENVNQEQTGDYLLADCDGDGVPNGTEIEEGTNPEDSCNFDVENTTVEPSGDYLISDCDGDGVTNGTEIEEGTDPTDPCDFITESATLEQSGNWLIADCDGDEIQNGQELEDGTDPTDPCDSINGRPPIDSPCDIAIRTEFIAPDVNSGVFWITNIEAFPRNEVTIYNRWGRKVYESNGYNNSDKAFRGISNGGTAIVKDDALPVGVYFYIIKYVVNGEFKNKKGYLYVNR